MRRLAPLLLVLALVAVAQSHDDDFAKSVREWTTKPEFLSPMVDHLPLSTGIPTPKQVLGSHIGSPKRLHSSTEIRSYFEALAAASPRVRIVESGVSDEGRPLWSVLIADTITLDQIETYRGYLQRLADPRTLSDAEAAEVLTRAKPIYHITAGLHSSETGPPEMVMELAYRLVAANGAPYDAIRQNLIVMITPALEPDGLDRYVEWYHRYKIHEESEDDRLPGPPYWGKYIYHDNNRDLHYSQVVMRTWLKAYLHWKPPVIHDLHESVPFLYTFSGQPPHNPNLDPVLYGELPWFANFELAKLTSFGMPGVWTHAFVDMYSVAYLGFMASNHNGLLRMYETYGNGGANTMKRKVDIGDGDRFSASKRQWYRPLPAYKEVEWSLRNNINYMQTAVLAALELASAHPRTLVENFYRKSKNAIAAGEHEAPYGWLIPSGQPDETRVAWIVNTLRMQAIEVGRLTAPWKLKDVQYPAGSYVIKRNQPYGRLAKSLLEKQTYPDTTLRTYDDTGWTMGLSAHATVHEITDKSLLTVPAEAVETVTVRGSVQGQGSVLAVVHNGAQALVTFRWRMKNQDVQAAEDAFEAAGQKLPAGTLLLANTSQASAAVEALGLRAFAIAAMPQVPVHAVDLPRLAVYSSWGSTQQVGWIRHALDHFEVPYQLIFKDHVRQGNLRAQFDVILIPNQSGSAKALVFDIAPGKVPLAYKAGGLEKTFGMYGASDDISGGMGLEGALEFQHFVQQGGTLITLAAASNFPAEFGITRDVSARATSSAFYGPGPIIEIELKQKRHPLFYGYPEGKLAIRYANGPVLGLPDKYKDAWTLAEYGAEAISGYLRGGNEIKGKPAILDVPAGQGRVILFATNPCYRWQNQGEFNMLFNAILHHNDRVVAK